MDYQALTSNLATKSGYKALRSVIQELHTTSYLSPYSDRVSLC